MAGEEDACCHGVWQERGGMMGCERCRRCPRCRRGQPVGGVADLQRA